MTNKVNISTDPGADAESISQAVASKLNAYRKEQKLSLDELSRRAGISKGMLVGMEKGLANPSIACDPNSPPATALASQLLHCLISREVGRAGLSQAVSADEPGFQSPPYGRRPAVNPHRVSGPAIL
ncbi:MAG: helix-turn-helix domain-containing protein [Oleiphilaceae bacterium]